MNQNTVGMIVCGLVVLALIVKSGVLALALLLGAIAFVVILFVSRDLKASTLAGSGTTAVVSLFGILAMLNPGWYQHLL